MELAVPFFNLVLILGQIEFFNDLAFDLFSAIFASYKDVFSLSWTLWAYSLLLQLHC